LERSMGCPAAVASAVGLVGLVETHRRSRRAQGAAPAVVARRRVG